MAWTAMIYQSAWRKIVRKIWVINLKRKLEWDLLQAKDNFAIIVARRLIEMFKVSEVIERILQKYKRLFYYLEIDLSLETW